MTVTIREARADDARRVYGRIRVLQAFTAIANGPWFPPDFPNAEVARGMFGGMIGRPGVYVSCRWSGTRLIVGSRSRRARRHQRRGTDHRRSHGAEQGCRRAVDAGRHGPFGRQGFRRHPPGAGRLPHPLTGSPRSKASASMSGSTCPACRDRRSMRRSEELRLAWCAPATPADIDACNALCTSCPRVCSCGGEWSDAVVQGVASVWSSAMAA